MGNTVRLLARGTKIRSNIDGSEGRITEIFPSTYEIKLEDSKHLCLIPHNCVTKLD